MTNHVLERPATHPPTWSATDSQRYILFSQSEEKFTLKQRFLLWIGENEDLDYDNGLEAEERLHDLVHTGLPREAISIKSYWYVSAGCVDNYLIAHRYTDYTEAEEALSRVKMRWFNQHMAKKMEV
jgi:hypothetical protein